MSKALQQRYHGLLPNREPEIFMSRYPTAEICSADTHQVENMPPLLEDYNLFRTDATLRELVQLYGADWAFDNLTDYGRRCGSAEWIFRGIEANRVKPVLETHDRYGNRIDEVVFHPAYHEMMAESKAQGLTDSPWTRPGPGAHVARAAGSYMVVQVEAGHSCPITMTFASVPTLRKQPEIAEEWLPKVLSREYDPGNRPYIEKDTVTIGMAMTEKQGGSDVRRNSTRAFPIGKPGAGREYELVGHKYFVSAPMCDAFLVTAQAEGGISCFLVPRWRPDGSKNPLQVLRLKDKMGNVSNASSETELRGAYGWLIGEEGRGVSNILEMVALTRFDCQVASAGAMRQHMSQIIHHLSHRQAFGDFLDRKPLMQNVLADLELETEAAAHLAFRVAAALDGTAAGNEFETHFARVATAVGKYWVCKRQPGHAYEAMECIGGSAAMENSIMPRFYREAPINAIWEGSGNVQCLDVLRALRREPDSLEALLAETGAARGSDARFDRYLDQLQAEFDHTDNIEYRARAVVEKMALALQGSLLLRHGHEAVAEAFCAGRLGGSSGNTYGMLPEGVDCATLIERGRLTAG
jgi:putative acyl-CoA dehydrogenase